MRRLLLDPAIHEEFTRLKVCPSGHPHVLDFKSWCALVHSLYLITYVSDFFIKYLAAVELVSCTLEPLVQPLYACEVHFAL